jgi:hypothetical protein
VHGLHVLANTLHQFRAHTHFDYLMGGTGFRRISAARACPCKPSP